MSTGRTILPSRRHVVVVGDGEVGRLDAIDAAWPAWDDDVAEVIAADGGYARARAAGLAVALLVGDMDSVDPSLVPVAQTEGTGIVRVPSAKDESDMELALLEAVRRGATRITILGALGGPRLDHALANVWLLAHPAVAAVDVALLDARTRVSLVAAAGDVPQPVTRQLPGRVGATISLLPLGGDVSGITTRGLRYPLHAEPLLTGPARGLSNVREAGEAELTVERGMVLVVETAF